jgi:hypothetical protein
MTNVKTCRACNENKDINDFPLFSSKECGRKNTCKSCSRRLSKIRSKLKKENPAPPSGRCPICNTYTESWILDHCHFNDSFRGYICNSCNLGVGRFNDDINLLCKAIDYLSEKTNI